MKKILLVITFILTLAALAFANEEKIKPEVLDAFKTRFSNAQDVTWVAGNNYFKASFNYYGSPMFAWYTPSGKLMGVMGIQDKGEVTLIRHAYVRTSKRGQGIGKQLLAHLNSIAKTPVLIGTWANATWAINFYLKNGFRLLERKEIDILLPKYWTIPIRQIETSVVLASPDWESLLRQGE